jgi:hypothetical protein
MKVQQGTNRLLLTATFGVFCPIFLAIAYTMGHARNEQGAKVYGPSVLGLGLFVVGGVLAIREFRASVTIQGDEKVRRIAWSRTVPMADVASFELSRNVLQNAWFGSARLKNGRRVMLPFLARSTIKDSPKNDKVLKLLKTLDDVRVRATWTSEVGLDPGQNRRT